MKKVIINTIQILFIIILVAVATILVTSKTDKLFGIRSFAVLTGSMQPTIDRGSLIFVQPTSTYTKEDIISFRQENVIITHRILQVDPEGSFITKGDANNTKDKKMVNRKDVIGKQVLTIPYFGNLAELLRTPSGFIALVIIPSLFFIFIEMKNIYRHMKTQIEKKVLETQET